MPPSVSHQNISRAIRSHPGNVQPMKTIMGSLIVAAAVALAAGCATVKVEPIEVKPIHITMDVNVKVDRALTEFFGDVDKSSSTINPTAF
jgi:hypothetical protein